MQGSTGTINSRFTDIVADIAADLVNYGTFANGELIDCIAGGQAKTNITAWV